MSFLATLELDGETCNILDCSFTFRQDTDYTGRPCSKPQGGQIRLLIESTSKTDFLEWMISPTITKKGEITFYRRDNMSSLKKVEFTGAYCIEYTEHFNGENAQPLQIHLILSAKEITVKGTTFENNWPAKA
ncbi:type VI secretion system tube protein TssD [Aquimarina sp. 2201CG5-10]|uniref:type VI secretion system tube protein TssD n=1 Tax=Aquimarina callyspongiae TaxID=3098150 RepID=UPI002AB588FC|nr:type VI secretion system tube protein TssD [Aquimarina sp. 2201CG5-10]MDY8138338.1 type VI secretion system tube protein TssD [Aquimarina sp. 2201CG5-10]